MAVAFVLALLATFIVAVVLAVFRFRKNLLTDEGCVMFTLPVSPHSLVCSKLIVSTVWFLGAVVIDVVALVSWWPTWPCSRRWAGCSGRSLTTSPPTTWATGCSSWWSW